MRSLRLDRMGLLKVVADRDLAPGRLAGIMARVLSRPDRVPVEINLNGAANTAAWLAKLKIAD